MIYKYHTRICIFHKALILSLNMPSVRKRKEKRRRHLEVYFLRTSRTKQLFIGLSEKRATLPSFCDLFQYSLCRKAPSNDTSKSWKHSRYFQKNIPASNRFCIKKHSPRKSHTHQLENIWYPQRKRSIQEQFSPGPFPSSIPTSPRGEIISSFYA